jgi:hypothetical protein
LVNGERGEPILSLTVNTQPVIGAIETTIFCRYQEFQAFYGKLENQTFDIERELLQLPELAWLKKQSWFKCVLLPPTTSVKPNPAEPKREWLKKDEQEWL